MQTIAIRYLTLFGLITISIWWAKTNDWEPVATFFCVLAGYIGTDIYDSKHNKKRVAHDTRLYFDLIATLPSNGSIAFIKSFNFAGFSFERKSLKDLNVFYYEWDTAEREFIDTSLEAKRIDLFNNVRDFIHAISNNTYPTHSSGCYAIPSDWEIDSPERFERTTAMIHSAAEKVVSSHQLLIRECKNRLNPISDVHA